MKPDGDWVLRSAILAGVTPLIPVPFLDDYARDQVDRAMCLKLFSQRGMDLTPEEIEAFFREPRGCCLSGCLSGALLYPVKKLLRKVLFVLEIKRATDIASLTLARGFLLKAALDNHWWQSTGDPAELARLSQAIREASAGVETSPLAQAVSATFSGSKTALRHIASAFTYLLEGEKPKAVTRVLEEEEVEHLEEEAATLRSALDRLPEGYTSELKSALKRALQTSQSDSDS